MYFFLQILSPSKVNINNNYYFIKKLSIYKHISIHFFFKLNVLKLYVTAKNLR